MNPERSHKKVTFLFCVKQIYGSTVVVSMKET